MAIQATLTMFFQPTINYIQFIPSRSDVYSLPIPHQSIPEDAEGLYAVVGAGDDTKPSLWVPQ